MSITDELRKYTEKQIKWLDMTKVHYRELFAIADRIDAEYQEAVTSVMNDALYYANDKDMAECGWVRLPKDADGEYIHIGDVMAYVDNTKPMEVVALVPPATFLTEDGPRYADMCRHHHAPTVEDVLREFSCVLMGKREFDGDVAEAISEYAAKLRLAGEDA